MKHGQPCLQYALLLAINKCNCHLKKLNVKASNEMRKLSQANLSKMEEEIVKISHSKTMKIYLIHHIS